MSKAAISEATANQTDENAIKRPGHTLEICTIRITSQRATQRS